MKKERKPPADGDDNNQSFLINDSMNTDQNSKKVPTKYNLEFLFFIAMMIIFVPTYFFTNDTIIIDILVIVALISMSIFCIKEIIPSIKDFLSRSKVN